jgi:hypothetical protein
MRVTIYVSAKNLDAINNFFDLKIPSEHTFPYSYTRTELLDAEISLPFSHYMVFKLMQNV